jgi:hypothetical protein
LGEIYTISIGSKEDLIECYCCGRIIPVLRSSDTIIHHLDYDGVVCPFSGQDRKEKTAILASGPVEFTEEEFGNI